MISFDHKYCIYPGNLFSMLKYQYLTYVFLNFKEALVDFGRLKIQVKF